MEQNPFEAKSKLSIDKILSEIKEIEENYGEPDRLWSMGDIDALLGIENPQPQEEKIENKPTDSYNDLFDDLGNLQDKYSNFSPADQEQLYNDIPQNEPVAVESPVVEPVEAEPAIVDPVPVEAIAEETVAVEPPVAKPIEAEPTIVEPTPVEAIAEESAIDDSLEQESPAIAEVKPFEVITFEQDEDNTPSPAEKVELEIVPDLHEVGSDDTQASDDVEEEAVCQPESEEEKEEFVTIALTPLTQEEEEKKPTVEELFPSPSLKYFGDEDADTAQIDNAQGLQGLFDDEVDEDVFKKLNSIEEDVPEDNETTKYKNKFIQVLDENKNGSLNSEPIEKPGIILKRGPLSETSGLEPLPQVIPAEEFVSDDDEATRVVGTPAFTYPQPRAESAQDEQLVFSGFKEEEPETISEEELAAELSKKRAEKKKKFVLLSKFDDDEDDEDEDIEDESEDFDDIDNLASEESGDNPKGTTNVRPSFEYEKPEHRGKIYAVLKNSLAQSRTSVIGLCIIDAIALLLMLVPKLFDLIALDAPAFSTGGIGLAIANIFLLLAGSYLALPALIAGFKALFKGRVTCETACALTVTISFIHAIILCFNQEPAGAANYFYSVAAIFALLLNTEGRRNDLQRMINNFEFCAFQNNSSLYAIRAVENEKDAFEIGKGLKMGNPEILYSGKILFPENFIANSRTCSVSGACVRRNLIVSAAVSAALAVLTGILSKDFFQAISAMTGAFCLSAPVSVLLSLAIPLRRENKKLNRIGAMIASYDSAESCSTAVAAAVDSADLFDRSACEMHGMKDYKTVRIDDVLLYATAIVLKSGGPLSGVFNAIIGGSTDILPPVKDMIYEDRLGLSATIYGQRVLFGNRNLLVHHNIDVPLKSEEDKYKLSGRKVIYIAIDSKVAAMFVIKYVEDSTLSESLTELERNGINLVVRTDDPNVTDELIASKFGIPSKNIKVTFSVGSQIFRDYRDSVVPSCQTGVLHDGSALSYFKSIAACSRIANFSSKYALFALIAQAIVAVSAVISVVLGTPALISPIAAMVAQAAIVGASVLLESLKN